MHILFVHQNFPAQFGHIGSYLAQNKGMRCTFVSERPAGHSDGIERIQYRLKGGATRTTHYCSRTFENNIWHTHGVYEALRARPDIKPDLIVGHSGFGSTLFLNELYDCPIINYFEYFYRPGGSDMDFRPDFPSTEMNRLRARARNAMLLLDLENCDAGYCPTTWQRSNIPALFHEKVRVIFDGIDTRVWHPVESVSRTFAGRDIPEGMKIVSYVSRGMESMRGFDMFMKAAKRLCDMRDDVMFIVVGEDRVCYGGDEKVTGTKSFKNWVLAQDNYDLSRFHFTGRVTPHDLVDLFTLTDLHMYLTVPFVLSWSLMNALACGATVLASDTAPVRDMIEHGQNGLLVDFFDVEKMAETASEVLDSPQDYKHLGQAGVEMIENQYSLDVCLPQMEELYQHVLEPKLQVETTPV